VATRIRHVLSGDPVDLNHVPCSEANLVVFASATSQAALKAVPVGLRVAVLGVVLLHVAHHVAHVGNLCLEICPEHHRCEHGGQLPEESDGQKDRHDR